MKEAYIYRVTNLLNGKVYIGQHDGSNSNYYASGSAIRLAVKKYGKESFLREILVSGQFTQDELDFMETMAIIENKSFAYHYHDRGYNLTYGGQGKLGHKPSKETVAKAIQNHPRRKAVVQFTLEGELVATYQSTLDAQRTTGINGANIYRVCSGETSQSRGYLWLFESDYLKGKRPVYVPATGICKQIAQYKFDGSLVATYPSTVEAAKATGTNRSAIANCLSGFGCTANNHQWKHFEGLPLASIPAYDPSNATKKTIKAVQRAIIQYDLAGNQITEFESSEAASTQLGIHISNIRACCRQDSSSTHGFTFRYKSGYVRRNKKKGLCTTCHSRKSSQERHDFKHIKSS